MLRASIVALAATVLATAFSPGDVSARGGGFGGGGFHGGSFGGAGFGGGGFRGGFGGFRGGGGFGRGFGGFRDGRFGRFGFRRGFAFYGGYPYGYGYGYDVYGYGCSGYYYPGTFCDY